MSTSLDMSLDDMIKSGKNSNRGRGNARGRGRGRGRGGTSLGRPTGITQKPSLGVKTRSSSYTIAKSFNKAKELISRHGLFNEMASAGLLGIETGLKLYISNLDYGVSNEDIKDLFSDVGKLKRSAVHYDRNGRPSGSAEVHFVRKSDALAAVTRYNNVQLDGKAMKIEIVGTTSDLPSNPRVNSTQDPHGRGGRTLMSSRIHPRKSGQGGAGVSSSTQSSSIRPRIFGQGGVGVLSSPPGGRRGGSQRGRGRGRGFSRGRGRGRNQPRVSSADELDKDLETYHAMTS